MPVPFIKRMTSRPLIVRILLLGLVYWLFCWIGTLTFYKDFGVAIYWPATGIAIAGVYILGSAASVGVFIAAFIINYFIYITGYSGFSNLILSVSAIATANTLGALIGSHFLKKIVIRNNRSLFRLDSVLAFLLFVVIIPSLITSVTGGAITYMTGTSTGLFHKIHTWFLADLIGVLVILPVIMSWLESPVIKINRKKIPEFFAILTLLIASGYFIFTGFFNNYFYNFMIAYFTTPIYFWLALRFDSKAVFSLQLLSFIYITWLAVYAGHDFFISHVNRPYVLLQGFSVLISSFILIVHSIFKERELYIISHSIEEEKYRSLFDNMPVSLWEVDFSAIKDEIDLWPENLKMDVHKTLNNNGNLFRKLISKIKIVHINRNSLELFGAEQLMKLEKSAAEIFAIGDSDALSSVLAKFYYGSSLTEERVIEVKTKRKKRFLSVSWLIMPGHEKKLSRILITILDISELKKAEKEIKLLNQRLEMKVQKRTDELARANRELEAFSYSVSHDLKAPLRAVRGFSSLLMEEYGGTLPQGAIHYIKNVQKNSENMTMLITDLLQFSRLGRKSIIYTNFDSYKLVNDILKDLYSLHKPEHVVFIINPLPYLIADENLLTQVFVNLFSNSVKFSKPGTANRIEVSCKSGPEFHEFTVSDQGIGFDSKHSEKIFKVFQRLHATEEYEGSGVGLSLVQRIIHRHGGIVRAESEPGKGTGIIFTIPVEIESE